MSCERSVEQIPVAILGTERRLRTALRALIGSDGTYVVSIAASLDEARALLERGGLAAVVVGLGPSQDADDDALVRLVRQRHPQTAVIVGNEDGLDLDAGPDAILAAVQRAVGTALASRRA